MLKGICVGSLHGGASEEGFALAKKAGFDGVELCALEDPTERQKAASLAKKHGLVVPSVMHMKHWSHPVSDPDPSVRKVSVDGMITSFETAEAAGADTVLLVPGVVNARVSYEEAWIRAQNEILGMLPMAAERGMVIAIENVWSKFLVSPTDFARFVDQFNSDHLRAYFDVGNIALYGIPHHWIRTLGHRIAKVHIKGFDTKTRNFTPTLLGGDLDWISAINALRQEGYDGWITAEMPKDKDDPEGGTHALSAEMDRIIAGDV